MVTPCLGVIDHEFVISGDITFNLPVIDQVDQPCFSINGSTLCIPSLICPGTMKSGTTFLYTSLTHHPNIATSVVKEVNFYSQHTTIIEKAPYSKGVEQYSSNFVHERDEFVIDFSPVYMMFSEPAELIYQTNRNTRFIVTLRDPVDRTYSHYRFQDVRFYDHKHIRSTLNSTCPNRRDILTFKHYLSEEYHVLNSCNMIKWNPPQVSILNNTIRYTIKSIIIICISQVGVNQCLNIAKHGIVTRKINQTHVAHAFQIQNYKP